ncbi:MAG: M1 family metallopeptidase [Tepidibacter sp.]|uniref:M1 family metallopeptidase n=1 Tax=Tepidibacter sp. TaxID=2529387 RepID=UPI0025D9D746|nr:M1 family metallopeptidase [Tepidibacter sp.]MCT4508216.1 M1 family metallopeptidase [Tepidibacter sp.]
MLVILNKKKFFKLFTVLFLLFSAITCFAKTDLQVFKGDKNDDLNEYTINASFNEKLKKLTCSQNVVYVNNTKNNLREVYFHIYPNAFSKEKYAPFAKNELKDAYPNGFSKGYIKVKSILNNQTKLSYSISGKKEDLLIIKLNNELKPDEKIDIHIEYDVKLPNSIGRFGYGDNTINITNWYPIACVHDERGWNKKGYEKIGDPFYSDVSNFNVIIKIPNKYKIASTGVIKSKKKSNDINIFKVDARHVRDFAFILSDKFSILSTNIKDTNIYSYFFDDKYGKEAFAVAKDSLVVFNDLFGKYPYKTYSVVESDFFIGGMEYPNLVMIDERLYDQDSKFALEYVVAHETAHQWWYSLVGNDEISEPWLDEALTEYSTILYFEQKYGKEVKDRLIKHMKVRTMTKQSKNIFKSTTEFDNSIDYSLCVYSKGALMIDDIRKKVGDNVFFDTLRKYYNENKYKNVTSDQFMNMWEKEGVNTEKIMNGNN